MGFVKCFTPFPNFPILPEKTHKSWHFWPRIDNGGCFTHLFLPNFHFCAIIFTPPILWKLLMPEFGKFRNKGNIWRNFLTNLPEPKNILLCHLWRIPCMTIISAKRSCIIWPNFLILFSKLNGLLSHLTDLFLPKLIIELRNDYVKRKKCFHYFHSVWRRGNVQCNEGAQ